MDLRSDIKGNSFLVVICQKLLLLCQTTLLIGDRLIAIQTTGTTDPIYSAFKAHWKNKMLSFFVPHAAQKDQG
jgi:hypothetical protein